MKLHALGLLIGFLSSPTIADQFGDDSFVVEIKPNFNTAEYFFTHVDVDDNSTYKLKFTRFFETLDGNTVGGSNIGLSSLDWSLENINTDNGVTFDIVGVDDDDCGFDEIRFQNTLYNNSVKFDLNITGYTFCGDEEDIGDIDINLVYTLTGGGDDDDEDEGSLVQSDDTYVYLAGTGAYFEVVDEAYQNDEVDPSVAVALDTSGNSVTTTYSGFLGGNLFHDPTFGAENNGGGGGGGIECFSPDATVVVKGDGKVPMKDVTVGDMVLTGSGQYSAIYTIDHQHATKPTKYLQIDTNMEGENPLEITPSHMLFIEGEASPIPASMVKVGDAVQTPNGYQKVIGIKSIVRNGLYNPITADGTIVVDGVVASTYNAFSADDTNVVIGGWKTPISHQTFLHMAVAPLRVVCMSVSSSLCETDEEYNAYSKFATYLWSQLS